MATDNNTTIVNTTSTTTEVKSRKPRTRKAQATEVVKEKVIMKTAHVYINGRFWQDVEVKKFANSEMKNVFANITTNGKVTFIRWEGDICKVTMIGLKYNTKPIQVAQLGFKETCMKIMEEQGYMRSDFMTLTALPGKIVVYVKDNKVMKELHKAFFKSLTIQRYRDERKWTFVQVRVITQRGSEPIEDAFAEEAAV